MREFVQFCCFPYFYFIFNLINHFFLLQLFSCSPFESLSCSECCCWNLETTLFFSQIAFILLFTFRLDDRSVSFENFFLFYVFLGSFLRAKCQAKWRRELSKNRAILEIFYYFCTRIINLLISNTFRKKFPRKFLN